MSYTTSWGSGGTISNSSSDVTLGTVSVPIGTDISVSLSGYAGSGTLTYTRSTSPTHTFFFKGYDDVGC